MLGDRDPHDEDLVVVWDGTYRHPASWGSSHGLLLVDEGAPVFLELEEDDDGEDR